MTWEREALRNLRREVNQIIRDKVATVEVLLRADRHDGNDPEEATAMLPCVPQQGYSIEVWDGEANSPLFLEVDHVVLNAYAPERIEVWVRLDGYGLDDLERAFEAIKNREEP